MYYVYILQNPKGLLYKGQTNDLCKRVNQHNDTADGFSSYTKGRGPWRLIYSEEFETRAAAKEREKFFKTGKGRDYLSSVLKAHSPDV